ncbi:MAG: hypothetical protein NTW16_07760 [Bacteroidetes bacterium]|nr:hypothetical protein [Bacteroidota bacterium]
MKKLYLVVALSLITQALSAETVLTIGNSATSTQKQPFGMYYGYERSATLYTTIPTSSLITYLGWYVGTGDPVTCPVKIYIKTVTSSSLTASAWTVMKTGATLVYSGIMSFPVAGWQTIDIADYVLVGTKIIVLCETNSGGIGATTYPVFRYSNASGTQESWQGDDLAVVNASIGTVSANRPNIQISYVSAGSPVPPSGFMSGAVSSSQINLNWVRNATPDNVLVAYNTTNTFGSPSGSYVAGNSIAGGGTVIFNGSGTTFSHSSGLLPATTYYYRSWSVNGAAPTYSAGTNTSTATMCEPATIYPNQNDFESTRFPPVCWSYAGLPWSRASTASGYGVGVASALANFFTLVAGNFDLISPELNLAALTDPIVRFDHAYATYNTQVDKLELWYSTNNGTSFVLLNTWLGGASGPLNTGGVSTVAFVPTSGQWATKTYALPAGTNRVLFRGVNLNGNNLYLDNITFLGTCTPALTPTAIITPGGPTTFCQGGSVNLVASGGTSYLWSTTSASSSIAVTASGSYTVTVTNASGCSDSESVSVIVTPLPNATITPSGPTTFCQGSSVTLSASGGTGYLWSTLATTSSITVSDG